MPVGQLPLQPQLELRLRVSESPRVPRVHVGMPLTSAQLSPAHMLCSVPFVPFRFPGTPSIITSQNAAPRNRLSCAQGVSAARGRRGRRRRSLAHSAPAAYLGQTRVRVAERRRLDEH